MQTPSFARSVAVAFCGAVALMSCGANVYEVKSSSSGKLPPATNVAPAKGANPQSPAANTSAGPKLTFEQTVVDFGEVWDVADMVGAFPFKNTGTADLVFSDIKASCGCTTTKLTPMTYPPGGANVIDVVWDPIGFGQQSKTITVRSNSTGGGIQVLTIKANIKPFAQFNGTAVQLGNLQVGEEHRQKLELSCVDPNFELLDLGASSKHIRVESLGPQANGTHGIEVILEPTVPWGMLNSKVTARLRGTLADTGEFVEHTAEMRIQASVVHELTVTPMLFAVGHVLPGRSFERVVRLERLDSAPFQITRAEIVNPVPATMSVEVEPYKIGPKNGVILRVKGQSGDYMGLISGQVRFETNIPGEGSHSLPVLGKIRN